MSSSRPRIFVVDDSREIRDLIGRLFEAEGYEVELACDGKDALEKLRARADLPAVILLDLMMPTMDGFQFRAEQVKDPALSGVPVLLMTADANAEIKAERVGAQGYLKKPVAVETLISVAEKFCGS